ncbi:MULTISPECIES: tail fiber domain-containing protein [unclassified Janthinobacterium]|uniref:tail fiber domain-containing protein n=1 Tax=unclassified Janthinobacterium TaxID=2610881 RepID=UPI00161C69AB|nr:MULTISPECIES: tail fiber domain-containing protein [unclassified Janthinobacterium]MBB5609806.1 hypothetical protein [Janthinobacterium sp. S3T4]MBB5615072.1 hypothetical protein [Janthinobacterium sp. S3M3]
MADYFYDGMPNVNERLNQLYSAFAAGPYNALPLVGGTITGQLTIDQRSGTAILALLGSNVPSYGTAILGYRGDVQTYFIGNESGLRGGNANDLVLDSVNNSIKFYSGGGGGFTSAFLIDGEKVSTARNLLPRTDNAYSLGSAPLAYNVVYARTGAINTSDVRLKCNFRDLNAAEIAAAKDLARAIGVYRWRDAVHSKGADAREHIGPTVQRAIEIMRSHGLDPFNYGFICYDEWAREAIEHAAVEARPAVPATEALPEVVDALGNVVTPAQPASAGYPAIEARAAYTEVTLEAGDRYAFRYDELAMFIAAGQEARLTTLEAAA